MYMILYLESFDLKLLKHNAKEQNHFIISWLTFEFSYKR